MPSPYSKRKQWYKEYNQRPETIQLRRHNEQRLKYGITWDDKVQMYKEQNGLCKLCGKPLPEDIGKSHTDHNHGSKKVRGLIHQRCNIALGYFENDRELLDAVVKYFKQED